MALVPIINTPANTGQGDPPKMAFDKVNAAITQVNTNVTNIASNTAAIAANTAAIAALGNNPSGFPYLPPPQAAAVGYNTLTFGPAMTLGINWQLFNQLSVTPVGTIGQPGCQAVQNADGSITLSPGGIADGSNFGANICTTRATGSGASQWTGTAFGGGFYAEAMLKYTPTTGAAGLPIPAYWALDTGFLQSNPRQWQGQAAGFIQRAELDIFQGNPQSTLFGSVITNIDWYGTPGTQLFAINNVSATNTTGSFSCSAVSGGTLTVGAYVTIAATLGGTGSIVGYTNPSSYKISATNGSTTFTLTTLGGAGITTTVGTITGGAWQQNILAYPTNPPGSQFKITQDATKPPLTFDNYFKIGCLWIPATASTNGSLTQWLNGVQIPYISGVSPVATSQTWQQFNAANAPPPIIGTTAGSVLDIQKMALILGTKSTMAITVAYVQVWQYSAANNVVQ